MAVAARLHLTRDDLIALTGYEQPKRMCAWLQERSWVFEPPARRGDVPKVACEYHDARMTGARLALARRDGPHFEHLAMKGHRR
jgi:hypothetical protein